jgi:DNA-binding transcriptional ArsR family regulator
VKSDLTPISALLTVISAPARIEILLIIGAGEACVCHLEARLGYRQAYISQHLMALRQAGLLDSRRDGKYVFYSLARPELMGLLEQAALAAEVNLPHVEAVRPEAQCACPNCAPEPIALT